MGHACRWGLTAARRRHWQPASQSRYAMPTAPGMPGAAPPDPGHGGESAGHGYAGIMPPPGGRGGAWRSPGAGPGIASARIRSGHQPGHGGRASGACGTASSPGNEASGPRPERRLIAGGTAAKSPGTPPGDDDLDAAAAHPGRPQTACAARRATPSARRPATGRGATDARL